MEGQRGSTLVEAVVASALLGIVIVSAMTALDTAGLGARETVRQAWANCVLRTRAEAVLAARYSDSYGSYTEVVAKSGDGLQVVRVQAIDSGHHVRAETFVYKSKALSQISQNANTLDADASCRLQSPAPS